MTQTPYIKNIKGFFCVVWAASYNGPFERDRSITPQRGYHWTERACESAYGVTPQAYGIGF
jgi:hypothetical protein